MFRLSVVVSFDNSWAFKNFTNLIVIFEEVLHPGGPLETWLAKKIIKKRIKIKTLTIMFYLL